MKDVIYEPGSPELLITKVVHAPRDLVFEVWTDPAHIANWWGPNGFTTTIHAMDVRPNGLWSFIMHGPDGTDYPNRIVYEEVVRPERLVYTHTSDDEDDPGQFRVTVTFEEHGADTKITLRTTFKSAEARDKIVEEVHAIEGGQQTLARLDVYVTEIRSTIQ